MITIGTIISFFVSCLCFILVLRINVRFGIPDFWLLLFTNSFLSLIGELVILPILSLACVLCPKNLEATIYSIFMSSLNLGGIFSELNGSFFIGLFFITSKNYDNLHWFILFTKFVSLLPLPLLLCINKSYFEPKEKEENKIKEEFIYNDNKNISKIETDLNNNISQTRDIHHNKDYLNKIIENNDDHIKKRLENSRDNHNNNSGINYEKNQTNLKYPENNRNKSNVFKII
jgi:hypothetical protein